jgi:polar amino acid transport system substrate-binding protein
MDLAGRQETKATLELAPGGVVRVAIALAPAASPFFAVADPLSGEPRGVTVTLGKALAAELGLPLQFVRYPNSGQITDRADDGEWDVTFMPADASRAQRVDFTPPYALVQSSFLVPPGSTVHTIEDVDRPGVKVVAIENTATARSAARVLKQANLVHAPTVQAAADALRAGEADALALSRDALATIADGLSGARVLDGHFHSAGVAAAVPKGRPQALRLVEGFIEKAKASGLVQRAMDEAGLRHAAVAPGRDARSESEK